MSVQGQYLQRRKEEEDGLTEGTSETLTAVCPRPPGQDEGAEAASALLVGAVRPGG